MGEFNDHVPRRQLGVVERLGDRSHLAARHHLSTESLDQLVSAHVADALLELGVQCLAMGHSVVVRREPRVMFEVFGVDGRTELLPEPWVADSHDDESVRDRQRLIGCQRVVSVAFATTGVTAVEIAERREGEREVIASSRLMSTRCPWPVRSR